MQTIIFECKTITPMFMYGADGKTPELRPASIKGVMRFWWRAICGNNNIEKLKDYESDILGSTDKRSKINIRVKYQPIENHADKNKINIVKIEDIPNMAYLFYPFYLDNAEKEKKCFINLEFKVILSSYDEKALKEASYSFILLSLFGGLGSRSRRGGGNFKINNISEESFKLLPKSNDRRQLSNFLYKIYGQIKKYFQQEYPKNNFTTEYSNLSSLDFALSYNKFDSWNQALKDIETKYKNFRKKNELLQNASFGLPIIFEDKKNSIKVITNPEFERRASPMIIKILQVQDKYYWFVLKLQGEFLPSNTKIGLDKNDINEDIYENIVDDFLEDLRK